MCDDIILKCIAYYKGENCHMIFKVECTRDGIFLSQLSGGDEGGEDIINLPLGGPLDPSPLFTEKIFPRKDLLPAKRASSDDFFDRGRIFFIP